MTKPIGGPNLNMANQLAQKTAADARLLNRDNAKGASLNAATLGRQSNVQADVKKATVDAAPKAPVKEQPKESFVSSTPAETPDPRQAETRGAEEQSTVRQQVLPDATATPAAPEQIREAAKNDPEIAKWASIADSSQNFLQQFSAENPGVAAAAQNNPQMNPQAAMQGAPGAVGVPGQGVPGAADPFAGGVQANAENAFQQANQNAQQWSSLQNQAAETQAQMFADHVKTQQSIQTIYQQMWAEVQKARAERHKLLLETANSVNSIMMELHVSRARTSQKMFNDMLNTLTGNYK